MKTYSHRNRNALIFIAICLFFSGYTANQAMASDARSDRAAVAGPASVRSANGARLIIHRIANLGNNLIVALRIDGVAVAPILYGQTYEGVLPTGRHVLSLLPTPNPRWHTPWQMALDVRRGETYNFTVIGDGSGHLVLKGGLELSVPAGDKTPRQV